MRKQVALGFVLVILVSVLSGCSNEQRAVTGNPTIDAMNTQQLGDALVRALSERAAYKDEADAKDMEVTRLQGLVQGIQFADPEFPALVRLEDDTNRVVFNKPGSYILLPEALVYPGVATLAVDNKLRMGGDNGIVLNITPVWAFRLEGNRLFVSSTTGVYGEIVLGRLPGEVDMDFVDIIFDGHPGQEEVRDEWDRVTQAFIEKTEGVKNNIPADPGKGAGKDGLITWSSRTVGRQVSLPTSVSGVSSMIRVGAFAVQNNAVTYAFVYESEYSDANEALILALITSITISNRAIAVEF